MNKRARDVVEEIVSPSLQKKKKKEEVENEDEGLNFVDILPTEISKMIFAELADSRADLACARAVSKSWKAVMEVDENDEILAAQKELQVKDFCDGYERLAWAKSQGCPWGPWIYVYAAYEHQSTEAMQFAIDGECEFDYSAMDFDGYQWKELEGGEIDEFMRENLEIAEEWYDCSICENHTIRDPDAVQCCQSCNDTFWEADHYHNSFSQCHEQDDCRVCESEINTLCPKCQKCKIDDQLHSQPVCEKCQDEFEKKLHLDEIYWDVNDLKQRQSDPLDTEVIRFDLKTCHCCDRQVRRYSTGRCKFCAVEDEIHCHDCDPIHSSDAKCSSCCLFEEEEEKGPAFGENAKSYTQQSLCL